MTKKEMSTESASPDALDQSNLSNDARVEADRMRQYKLLAAAFCYPDDNFFELFEDFLPDKQSLQVEYDRIFRTGAVWLYGAEHLVKNEFQRANMLSDIMGFYTAFGLEPDKERPDSITCELEFMYGLIFKRQRLDNDSKVQDAEEKTDICRDAEKKFFTEHLDPAAMLIGEKIISQSSHAFYVKAAREMLSFLESERKHFNCAKC